MPVLHPALHQCKAGDLFMTDACAMPASAQPIRTHFQPISGPFLHPSLAAHNWPIHINHPQDRT